MNSLTKVPASADLMLWSMKQELHPPEQKTRIFLLDCPVAGASYYQAKECVDSLEEGTHLMLRREANNPHDANAIEVFWQTGCLDGFKLGYVPRIHNPILARLMDAGKHLTAELNLVHATDAVNRERPAEDLHMSIFLGGNKT